MKNDQPSNHGYKWVLRTLLFSPIGAILAFMSLVSASGLKPSVPASGLPYITAGSVLDQEASPNRERTRKNTVLPSEKYQYSFDLAEISQSLGPLDAKSLQDRKPSQIGDGRQVGVSSDSEGGLLLTPAGTRVRKLAENSPAALRI